MAYSFQLPLITDLTVPQQAVLNEPGPVYISGGPGTGKSVVSLWRHMRNKDRNIRSILLTYTTTLATYLSAAARSTNPQAADATYKIFEWLTHNKTAADEFIVDEAQDLSKDVYQKLLQYADKISYGADDQQIIYHSKSSTEADLKGMFPTNRHYPLDENFRNTYEILRFVQAALPNKAIYGNTMKMLQNRRTGPKPRIVVTGANNSKQTRELLGIINAFKSDSHNIAVLVPLAGHVVYYYNIIAKAGIKCSRYHYGDKYLTNIENVHITTFASAKGTEFDTVIVPDFESFRSNMKRLYVGTENHYYVALTRARRNLYLLSSVVPKDINANTFTIETV